MSKNFNYSKQYDRGQREKVNPIDETSTLKTEEVETVETVEIEEEVVVEKAVKKEAKPKTLHGKVVGCAKLNVRKTPDANTNNVVITINAGTELTIDKLKSNNDWYYVCTAAGVEGYCMKAYVSVK